MSNFGAQMALATAGVLLGNETEPGAELRAALESGPAANIQRLSPPEFLPDFWADFRPTPHLHPGT